MTQLQFFNDDLCESGQSYDAYQEYWAHNRKRLPDVLRRINGGMLSEDFFPPTDEVIFLHDARIQSVVKQQPDVTLHLHGDHHGGLREITLQYIGVRSITPIPEILLSDTMHADLMCHETTLSEENYFNHKMLFASSDIVSIDFSSLEIKIVDQSE